MRSEFLEFPLPDLPREVPPGADRRQGGDQVRPLTPQKGSLVRRYRFAGQGSWVLEYQCKSILFDVDAFGLELSAK